METDGDWEGYRVHTEPGRPVHIWNLCIGSIFAGTVSADGSHWCARLNSTGLGSYPSAEQAKAVVDYQV
jgi:hypothetical protein